MGGPAAPAVTIASVPGNSVLLSTSRSRCTALKSAVMVISTGSKLENSGSVSALRRRFARAAASGGQTFGGLGGCPAGAAAGFWP